jgi:hypothetical protein
MDTHNIKSRVNYRSTKLQKNKQTNKQAEMIRKANYEQKTFDCETRYYNNSNNSIKLVMIRI